MTFDYAVFKLVQEHADIDIYQDTKIKAVDAKEGGGYTLSGNGKVFNAQILIGCDGAQSVVSRLLTQRGVNHRHHCGAVRAYYSGVEGIAPNTTECYLLDKYIPGYFWLFPVENGLVNAGFGMRSDFIADKRFNLRQAFYDFMEEYPLLKEKMRNAQPVGKLQGFSLPLGSQWVKMSGPYFYLAGDAASLIDPISGDGIGNAMLSGYLAAGQAIESLQKEDFSEKMGEKYEEDLYSAIGKELWRKGLMQQIASQYSWLLKPTVFMVKNKYVKRLMHKML